MSQQQSSPPLGPIGTRVLFENEHIRVWAVELPAKGHQPLHEHRHPYLIVPISAGRSVMKWPDGRERQLSDVPGDVKYREASGGAHELFNLEDTGFHSVLVEIKAAGSTG
jgi:beta-alanine degradation protein BauB